MFIRKSARVGVKIGLIVGFEKTDADFNGFACRSFRFRRRAVRFRCGLSSGRRSL
jgi:hypothetical protein